ncbi:hypothetical protein CDAR_444951 [Caerostris darwini]|uniref:Uncharacterized protein n=1 Tax=Caerostris darwini TaxID=1538125 RepID=A0AAV4MPL4_9ARAC|nr:hypothetical protein CDAR_444951 [Caerostris darwini]
METLLGWSLMGKLENEVKNDSYMTVLSLHVNNKSISDLWSLDTLGILDTADKQSQMEIEKETEKLFLNSVKQNEDGRYVVSLPWLEDHPVLPSNKGLSEKRLKNTVDRIKNLGILRDYENVFEDWKKEGATLNHLLDGAPDCYKMTAQHLQKSMYVDNCVASVKSEADLTKFINESREIMALGKFELRGWQHNSFESLRDNCNESQNASPILQDIPVLGLLWNIERDTLKIDVRNDTQSKSVKVTKRYILSKCHKIFDPIGITAPITLIPKILLQETWKIKANWDDILPEEIAHKFEKWDRQLHQLNKLEIPRWIQGHKNSKHSLHVFCDASQQAYATCIF